MNDSHTVESDSMPDLLQAPRLKSRAINESTGTMQSAHSGVGLSGCQMMRQNITAASLSALGSHMDQGNSCGEICLEGESFLQSLESIPMPTVAQQASEIGPYAPAAAFQNNLYANMNESDDKHNSPSMQHEILNAWGASGPPTNGTAYLHSNSSVSYMHLPYDANQTLGSAPRRNVRGGRGRGRGRGLRKRLMQNVLVPSSHLSFSPHFLPVLHDMRGRGSTPANAQTHYLPKGFSQMSKPQTPLDNSGLMLSGIVTQNHDLNADSMQTCEDSLVNEKMDAYIEKFSTDSSMDTVEPLIPIDRSHKPNTLSEAIGMYIDYLIRENEKKTHISSCSVAQVPLDLHKEDYYQQVMCRPVSFPTNKFRDWLKLYDVDIEITDPDGQTVSQTTFPPSGDFTDVHGSGAATAVSLLNWQTHGDGADQPSVSPGPCFNMEAAVRRFRNRGRVAVGHFQQCPHYPSVVTMANYPAGCNQNGLPADTQFQRNGMNAVRTVTSYPHGIAQFKTIRVPALEAMRYLNRAPTGNIPVPLSSFATSPYHQANGRFPAPALAKSNYYRMATVVNAANMPYDKETGRKGVPSYPGVLVSDMKPADADEAGGYDEAASMQNRGFEAMTTANRNLIPPISSMLTSFHNSSSGFNASSNFQTESDPGYVQTQIMDRTCRANEGDDVLPEPRSKSAFVDCAVEPDMAIASMSLTLKSENVKNVNVGIDLECQYSATDTHDNLAWNTALTGRQDNVPVLREMVDQSIQTENDEIEGTHVQVCSGTRIKIKCELQDGALGQNMSSFSYDGVPEYCRKVEKQLSSDVLLRNESVILNGTLEIDENSNFPCQELGLLTSSQISGFEFDGLGQLETCGVQSCVLTSMPCDDETWEKAETPGALIVRCGVNDSMDQNESATEPVLDVASNVEINSEENQKAEENSEGITEWSDAIPCKRSRLVSDEIVQSSMVHGPDQTHA